MSGTNGRVYGGDPAYIHVEDGKRLMIGREIHDLLEQRIRWRAYSRQNISYKEAMSKPLCPGCFMVVLFNAAVATACSNGQTLTELGRSMAAAFKMLEENPTLQGIEEITVMLDPEECPEDNLCLIQN